MEIQVQGGQGLGLDPACDGSRMRMEACLTPQTAFLILISYSITGSGKGYFRGEMKGDPPICRVTPPPYSHWMQQVPLKPSQWEPGVSAFIASHRCSFFFILLKSHLPIWLLEVGNCTLPLNLMHNEADDR